MAEIQKKIVEHGGRIAASRFFHAVSDKDTIAAWRQDLHMILQIFNVRLISLVFTVTESFRFRLSCQ